MEYEQELDTAMNGAFDSIKQAVLNLEVAAPLLAQRHAFFQGEATRLIANLQTTQQDMLLLLDLHDIDPAFEALIQGAATKVRTCAICTNAIQAREPSVSTTRGEVVHIACADQLAAEAQMRQRRWALAHGAVVLGVVLVVAFLGGLTPWLFVLTIVGTLLHARIHRRWWYYLRQDLGTWLLLGRRK